MRRSGSKFAIRSTCHAFSRKYSGEISPRTGFGSLPFAGAKCASVPLQIVQQHVREKEEAHFFAIAQFYIWMALQDLVEPGRAAAEGTDSYKGGRAPLYRIAFLRQIFLPF